MSVYATRLAFGDFGDLDPPLAYLGSHLTPSALTERAGYLLLCESVMDRDGLRLSVGGAKGDAAIVLDRSQVEALHREIGSWLEPDR